MKVLAVGCHPDDVEVACAGTLAKYKKLGHDVTVCHTTNGNMGHVDIMPPELRVMRIGEAKNAGAIAGIKVRTLDIGDLLVYDGLREQRDMMVDMLRQEQPDVIITHSPNDYMPDHVAVSKLVFDASFTASCPHYETAAFHGDNALPPSAVVPLFYMDTLAGVGFMPTEYVDIGETIKTKLEMLECHISQMKWMRDHDHIDFAEFVATCAHFRGLQSGCDYAEAFTACVAWPKITTKRMLP